MKFYQYATGRALMEGYGFVVQTEGISFNNASFRTARDLSRMPQNTVVYEMHGIDQQHTALLMTRVDSFGSGNYCYTHALITEQEAEPASLAQLLRPDSFLNSEEFLEWEQRKDRGERMSRKEIELPRTDASYRSILNELDGKRDVLYRFLGYLWNLCWQRHLRQEFRPAVIVLPKEWDMQKMIRFYTDCVLPLLPGELRHQASVVFGAAHDCFGEFPPTTTCYVLQDAPDNVMPVFDFAAGVTISNNDYTNVLVYELGKGLCQDVTWTLTRGHRNLLPGLPEHSVGDFALAYRFQHLDILANQNTKSMALYQQHFCRRYMELWKILRERYSNVDIRRVLTETERKAFRYWCEVSAKEETPPELYADLVQKALITPDEELWKEYLEALRLPCRLSGNEREEDVLLGRGRWKRVDLPAGLEGLNHERFGQLLAGLLQHSGDVMLTQTLIESLTKRTLECETLRNVMLEIFQQNMNTMRQSEVKEVLDSHIWQDAEKTRLIKTLVDERVENTPSGESLLMLCTLLQMHRYERAVEALLQCAAQFRMNAKEAESLADALIHYADQVKADNNAQKVLALYKEQPNEKAMCTILEKLFRFDYDRSDADAWVQQETKMIRREFVKDLSEVHTAEQLLKAGDEWSSKAKKKYRCEWNEFATFIPQADADVRGACGAVIRTGLVADLYSLAQNARSDWFGQIVIQEVGQYTQNNMDKLVSDARNFPVMEMFVELAAYPECAINGDARIQCIRYLKETVLTSTDPFNLYKMLEELPKTGASGYIRHWATMQQPETLEWEIVLKLMTKWGDPRGGWEAFFKEKGWAPAPKSSPWKGELFPMQALRYVCSRLVAAGAEKNRREELLRFVTTGPAWSRYVRHMENQREYRVFVRDENAQSPSVRAWLGLK